MKILRFTVYPKNYAHGFCFAVLCCSYTLTDFTISIRLTSLALWQSNDCPSASKATLMNMDKYFMWIHYERLHNHNKAKHNKTVCIFLGIYCKRFTVTWRLWKAELRISPEFIVILLTDRVFSHKILNLKMLYSMQSMKQYSVKAIHWSIPLKQQIFIADIWTDMVWWKCQETLTRAHMYRSCKSNLRWLDGTHHITQILNLIIVIYEKWHLWQTSKENMHGIVRYHRLYMWLIFIIVTFTKSENQMYFICESDFYFISLDRWPLP